MAQIMRYHEWPNTFNWSIMPNDPSYSGTNSGSLAIATLMSEIGANVDMNYSETGSSAHSDDARDAFVNNYNYSNSADYSDYNFSTVKQDIKMYNRPVYMEGCHSFDTTGTWFWEETNYFDCHAWVCDGYKQQYDVYIHNEGTVYEYTQEENRYEWLYMNWGWRGAGNGWFFRNQFYINGVLIENTNPNYQYNKKCIYRIKP